MLFTFSIIASIVALAGCGSQRTGDDFQDLKNQIAKRLPSTWTVAAGSEVKVELAGKVAPDEIVLYRKEPATIRAQGVDGRATEKPAYLAFKLTLRELIPPERYRELKQANDKVKKEREFLLSNVASLPKGESHRMFGIITRDQYEETQYKKFEDGWNALPPYDEGFPDFRFGNKSVKLWDWRPLTNPVERELQTEMNTIFSDLKQIMEPH